MVEPSIAVVILNWNGIDDTIECIESLEKSEYTTFKIIVLDNGSTNDSVERLRTLGDRIELIENPRNDGFAGGSNIVVNHAVEQGYDYIFLLNNDTTVAPDCLKNLVEGMNEFKDSEIILAPRMFYYDTPEEIWHDGHIWEHLRGQMTPIENYPIWKEQGFNEVDHIIGTALFFKSDLIKKYGLFDERFYLNYEETDWEFRLRAQGVRLITTSEASIWHKISKSFTHSVHSTFYCERNRLLFIEKNFKGFSKLKLIIYSELPRQLSIVLKMMRRFFGRIYYKIVGNGKRYRHTRKKYLDNKMAVVAWTYYLRKKFGSYDRDFEDFKG